MSSRGRASALVDANHPPSSSPMVLYLYDTPLAPRRWGCRRRWLCLQAQLRRRDAAAVVLLPLLPCPRVLPHRRAAVALVHSTPRQCGEHRRGVLDGLSRPPLPVRGDAPPRGRSTSTGVARGAPRRPAGPSWVGVGAAGPVYASEERQVPRPRGGAPPKRWRGGCGHGARRPGLSLPSIYDDAALGGYCREMGRGRGTGVCGRAIRPCRAAAAGASTLATAAGLAVATPPLPPGHTFAVKRPLGRFWASAIRGNWVSSSSWRYRLH